VGEVGAEDGELVAAEAGDGVARPQDAAQATGDRDQQPVDGVVAEALGHLLEAVQVEHEHGRQPGVAAEAGQGHLQPVQEQPAVGQPVRASWVARQASWSSGCLLSRRSTSWRTT
jgi:hypothetical protein